MYMHEINAVILSRGNLSRLKVCEISPWSSMLKKSSCDLPPSKFSGSTGDIKTNGVGLNIMQSTFSGVCFILLGLNTMQNNSTKAAREPTFRSKHSEQYDY